jgi:hypothetical protein
MGFERTPSKPERGWSHGCQHHLNGAGRVRYRERHIVPSRVSVAKTDVRVAAAARIAAVGAGLIAIHAGAPN